MLTTNQHRELSLSTWLSTSSITGFVATLTHEKNCYYTRLQHKKIKDLGDAEGGGSELHQRFDSSWTEFASEQMASFCYLAVVCAVVATGGCDVLQQLCRDFLWFKFFRMGGIEPAEVYISGGSIGELGGRENGEHGGEVMLFGVAYAVVHAQDGLKFREVFGVGDDHERQCAGHLEPLGALAPLRGGDFGFQLRRVPDTCISSESSSPRVFEHLHEAEL